MGQKWYKASCRSRRKQGFRAISHELQLVLRRLSLSGNLNPGLEGQGWEGGKSASLIGHSPHQCCPEMTFTNSHIKGARCLLFCYFLRKLQDLQVHCRDLSAETWTHQKAALAMPAEFVFNPMSRFVVSKTYLQQAKQERCTISALPLMNSACFGPVAQWRATKSIVFQLIRPKFPQDRSWKHSSGFFFISYPFISINLPKKKMNYHTITKVTWIQPQLPNLQVSRAAEYQLGSGSVTSAAWNFWTWQHFRGDVTSDFRVCKRSSFWEKMVKLKQILEKFHNLRRLLEVFYIPIYLYSYINSLCS